MWLLRLGTGQMLSVLELSGSNRTKQGSRQLASILHAAQAQGPERQLGRDHAGIPLKGMWDSCLGQTPLGEKTNPTMPQSR